MLMQAYMKEKKKESKKEKEMHIICVLSLLLLSSRFNFF
jgi:hypothetical protein